MKTKIASQREAGLVCVTSISVIYKQLFLLFSSLPLIPNTQFPTLFQEFWF